MGLHFKLWAQCEGLQIILNTRQPLSSHWVWVLLWWQNKSRHVGNGPPFVICYLLWFNCITTVFTTEFLRKRGKDEQHSVFKVEVRCFRPFLSPLSIWKHCSIQFESWCLSVPSDSQRYCPRESGGRFSSNVLEKALLEGTGCIVTVLEGTTYNGAERYWLYWDGFGRYWVYWDVVGRCWLWLGWCWMLDDVGRYQLYWDGIGGYPTALLRQCWEVLALWVGVGRCQLYWVGVGRYQIFLW